MKLVIFLFAATILFASSALVLLVQDKEAKKTAVVYPTITLEEEKDSSKVITPTVTPIPLDSVSKALTEQEKYVQENVNTFFEDLSSYDRIPARKDTISL